MIAIDVSFPDKMPLEVALLALANKLRSILPIVKVNFLARIEAEVYDLISRSPEGTSLQGGTLQAQLGVTDPGKAMREITRAITSSILWQVPVPPYADKTTLKCEVRVSFLESSLVDILSISSAVIISENLRPVKWLEWLLTAGSQTVVESHVFTTKIGYHRTRTGLGSMVIWPGGPGWHVPEFAQGTIADNWLTRSLRYIRDRAENIFQQLFTRYLAS